MTITAPITGWDIDPTKFGQNSISIETSYAMGRAYQWAREFLFNSVEAGASLVSFTVDWVEALRRNIYRRVIADNGNGMTRSEISAYINHIGGGKSLRSAGAADNLGQGAKYASAPFNRAGVAYISRTVEDGDAMCIYACDPDTGEYGLVNLWGLNDNDDVVRRSIHRPQPLFFDEAGDNPFDDGTDWRDVADTAFGNISDPDHGTIVVFLGDGENDTFLGDPSRNVEAEKYGLMKYLDSRLYEVPAKVTVRVVHFDQHGNKALWPKSEQDLKDLVGDDGSKRVIWQWRYAKGLRRQVEDPKYLTASGAVTVVSRDGVPAVIRWYITNFASTRSDGGARSTKSSTLINPGGVGTIMEVSAAARLGLCDVLDFTSGADAEPVFKLFGVDLPAVQDQLWVTLTPQLYRPGDRASGTPLVPGVHMDGSRSHLVVTSDFRQAESYGTVLREWGHDFQTDGKFPPEIQALLDAAYGAALSGVDALDQKTKDRIAGMLRGALLRQVAIIGGKRPKSRTEGSSPFRRRDPRNQVGSGKRHPNPSATPDPTGSRSGGKPTATGSAASLTQQEMRLPVAVWRAADDAVWAGRPQAVDALPVLPGKSTVPGMEGGAVYLKGHGPKIPVADRARADGSAYGTADGWRGDESSLILAAVEDKQSEYTDRKHWFQVEIAVKEAYEACAVAVLAHILATGNWDASEKVWEPTDGQTPDNYDLLTDPWVFSVSLRGFYPQKQIASTFLGSITKKIQSRRNPSVAAARTVAAVPAEALPPVPVLV